MSDLSKRLRDEADYLAKAFGWTGSTVEAADAISSLTSKLEEAEKALQFYCEPSNYKGEFVPGGHTDHGTFALAHHVNLVRKDAGNLARTTLSSLRSKP